MRILIVEDEALLAMELESEVEAAGHDTIGVAADSREAIDIVNREKPDFAFVDIQLRDGPTGVAIGQHLSDKSIPYVFVSGNLKRIPEDFAGALGAIEKPYTMNGLQNALSFLENFVSGGKKSNPPPSLVISPMLLAVKST